MAVCTYHNAKNANSMREYSEIFDKIESHSMASFVCIPKLFDTLYQKQDKTSLNSEITQNRLHTLWQVFQIMDKMESEFDCLLVNF